MKITVFNGSPAGKNSNTQVIVDGFLKGGANEGAETETIYLKDYKIDHCKGCFSCWFKTPGQCAIEDDMIHLMEKYRSSDVVVYGTPVYTHDMTAYLKNFVDRLIPNLSPLLVTNGGSFDLEKNFKSPQIVAISNCGFPGGNNFDILKQIFAAASPVLEIYRNSGKLLKNQDEGIKEKVESWLSHVTIAGEELVRNGMVSEGTMKEVNAELLPIEDYVKMLGM